MADDPESIDTDAETTSTDYDFLADVLDTDRISTEADDRSEHAGDYGTPENRRVDPDVVVRPESTADVSAVLAAANDRGVPVTPYAAGTGLEGNATPTYRGISLDLMDMSGIEPRPDDRQVAVGPGAVGAAVNNAVEGFGLWFPPLPASGDQSTIGGMIANDASGMQAVKYGEVHDWVLGLEAVLADGTIVSTGSKAIKTSSGYNLTDLLVGSEGTLGVVTGATLRLTDRPTQVRGGRAVFDSLDGATEAVFEAVRSGIDVARIELVDNVSARMANAYLDTGLPDAPMVFLEFHAERGIEAEIEACGSIFADHDVSRFEMAADESAMDDLWKARRELTYAIDTFDATLSVLHPGDVTVPISKYAATLEYAKELAAEYDLLVPCFGHAGDGNVHYSILVDHSDEESVARGEEVNRRIVERAIEYGGTATGEHGIGQGKREFLEPEHGAGTVRAMRAIKRALDPNDTLNPGKIFPETANGKRVKASSADR